MDLEYLISNCRYIVIFYVEVIITFRVFRPQFKYQQVLASFANCTKINDQCHNNGNTPHPNP